MCTMCTQCFFYHLIPCIARLETYITHYYSVQPIIYRPFKYEIQSAPKEKTDCFNFYYYDIFCNLTYWKVLKRLKHEFFCFNDVKWKTGFSLWFSGGAWRIKRFDNAKYRGSILFIFHNTL